MNNSIITPEDINEAARLLGIYDGFDDERQAVIQCLDDSDVVACPGSGKTTALLAKLIILANKMPFPKNKGICVLTHTNVAIDEIKEKIGDKANLLLSYPNFVGTIQSFVDRYLAVPACINYFGYRPTRIIEDDEYIWRLVRKFHVLYSNFGDCKLDGFLYGKLDNSLKSTKNWSAITKGKEEILCSLRMDYVTKVIKRNVRGNEIDELKNPKSDSYKEYWALIVSLIKDGVLSYNDAYGLALKYINDHKENIVPLFSERFGFVFIDEMQDTNPLQLTVLSEIFDKSKVVLQCYGDPKQAIYESLSQGDAWIPNNPLFITNSKRFSNNIAKVADGISREPYAMTGSSDSAIPPIIITYKNNNVGMVLEIFAKIISYFKLQTETNTVFKAVGMVKGNDKLGIKDYFPEFEKNNAKGNTTRDFPALCLYLTKLSDDIVHIGGTKGYYSRFINALLKVLRLSDIKTSGSKHFSKSSFLKHMMESDERLYTEMHKVFTRCILFIENNKEVLKHFRRIIVIMLKRLFDTEPNSMVIEFVNNMAISSERAPLTEITYNTFESDGVKIEIDTVHGVKGQTHCATLYLETVYYEKAVENIIEYFTNGQKKKLGTIAEKHLKVAYVAMTRPKKLLCVTMDDLIFEQNRDRLVEQGWVKYDDIIQI